MCHSLSNSFRLVKNFQLKSKPSLCTLCMKRIKHTQNIQFMVKIFSSIPTFYFPNHFMNFCCFLWKVYTKICWTVIDFFGPLYKQLIPNILTYHLLLCLQRIGLQACVSFRLACMQYIFICFCFWMVFQNIFSSSFFWNCV